MRFGSTDHLNPGANMPDISNLSSLSAELGKIAAAGVTSTVRVHARRGPSSSGLVWRPGLIVTADEAIEADDAIEVTLPDGTKATATLAGRDPSTDIAVLRCAAATGTAPAPASAASLGQLAVAVGLGRHGPLCALAMISSVSGPWQSQRGGRIDQFIGLDMRFDRRLEGASLLAPDGTLIGMVAAGPHHTSLAIPAATIERVAAQLDAKGKIARGYLGLGLQPVEVPPPAGSTDKRRGVMVVSVDNAGPGQAAGVLQGDIVLSWNGQPVGSVHGIFRRLGTETVGQGIDLALLRAGQPAAARLIVGERPTT
jgi:S1-C subfamily serine protease